MKKEIVIEEYSWIQTEVSLSELIELTKGKDLKNIYVQLHYTDPYDENPHLRLVEKKYS